MSTSRLLVTTLALATLLAGCGRTVSPLAGARTTAIKAQGLVGSAAGIADAAHRLAAAFMAADDRDHDGRLSAQEFQGYRLPDIALTVAPAAIDTDRDGFVSAAELSASLGGAAVVRGYQGVYNKQFQAFDADGDEHLSRQEFDAVLKSGIGQYLTPSSFYSADANNDGKIDPSEYEDLAFATYVDFVLVPFVQQHGGRDRLGATDGPLVFPPLAALSAPR